MLIGRNTLLDPKFWAGYWFATVGVFTEDLAEPICEVFQIEEDALFNWWNDFTRVAESDVEGEIEDPETMVLTFSHEVKLSIDLHSSYTYYIVEAPGLDEPELLGCTGPHHSFPIFRWEEVIKLASLAKLEPSVERIEKDLALLILSPCAWLTRDDDLEAASKLVLEAWHRTGITDPEGAKVPTGEWLKASDCLGSSKWWYDDAGWVTDAYYNFRRRIQGREPLEVKKINEILLRATAV
jgi:hypothetical protein